MKKLLLSSITLSLLFIPNAHAGFLDVDATHYNHEAILQVESDGIIEGYADGTFKPDQPINRAEFTKIVMEAVYPGEAIVEDCFSDVKSQDWFADYVCNAKYKDIIEGYEDGTFRPADNINFVEAAKIISVAYGFASTEAEIWYEPFVTYLGQQKAIPTTINTFDKDITRGEMAEMIFRIKGKINSKNSTDYNEINSGQVEFREEIKASINTSFIANALAKDGIPALDNPKFTTADKASVSINDETLGLLVENNGESKFYPYNILTWHEIVNDTVGGKPLAITFCPLCATGIAYERNVNGQILDFGVSGKLYESNLVMYDRQSETLWSQILGKGIVGKHTNVELNKFPSSITEFKNVKDIDDLQVLSTSTGYDRDYANNPYQEYEESDVLVSPISNNDQRLPAKTVMYAVNIDGTHKAYVYHDLIDEGTLEDEVNSVNLVINVDPETDEIVVTNTETQERYIGYNTFWFAWSTHHPGAEFWQN